VLLGSIASDNPSGAERHIRQRLLFPATFVGRGDMSRGGVLLRAAAASQELEHPVFAPCGMGPAPDSLAGLLSRNNSYTLCAAQSRRWGVFNLVGFGGFATQIGRLRFCPGISAGLRSPQPRLSNWRRCKISSATPVGRGATARRRLARMAPVPWRYQIAKTASLAANLAITALLIHAALPPELANTAAVLACAIRTTFSPSTSYFAIVLQQSSRL
jgi:hypothetical protein